MTQATIPFPTMPWQPGAHPLERKKHDTSHSVTILEFEPGFLDPNWCERGHVGYVLSGSVRLEYEKEATFLGEGEAFVIGAGTRHRASNPGTVTVRLFVVSSEEPPEPA